MFDQVCKNVSSAKNWNFPHRQDGSREGSVHHGILLKCSLKFLQSYIQPWTYTG